MHSDLIDEEKIRTSGEWMLGMDNVFDEASFAFNVTTMFNKSPFFSHNHMSVHYENEEMVGRMDFTESLVGNIQYKILHGGSTATMLDSIGGVATMLAIYRKNAIQNKSDFEKVIAKVSRVATVDIRIDYLSPGRGKSFLATAEIVRIGNKGSTIRMSLYNEKSLLIAVGIASYAF